MDENGLSPSKHHRRELRYESWIGPLRRLRSSSDSKNAGYGKQVDMFGSSAGLRRWRMKMDEDGWSTLNEHDMMEGYGRNMSRKSGTGPVASQHFRNLMKVGFPPPDCRGGAWGSSSISSWAASHPLRRCVNRSCLGLTQGKPGSFNGRMRHNLSWLSMKFCCRIMPRSM